MIKYFSHYENLFLEDENKQEQFFDTLDNDQKVIKLNDCYFFTEEVFNSYPDLTAWNVKSFETYIKWEFENEDDIYLPNGECITYEALEERAKIEIEYGDQRFFNEFMVNPEKAITDLKKRIKTLLLSEAIGYMIAEITKEEGIKIDLELTKESYEMEMDHYEKHVKSITA